MKAFRFPLQAILTLREERERETQRTLARCLQTAESIRARLATLARQLAELGTDLAGRLHHGIPARELEELGNYRHLLSERQLRCRHELAAAERAAQRAQAALLRATQDRQALETHRDKLHRHHDYAASRAEQKLLDELAGRTGPTGLGRPFHSHSPTP